MKLRITSLLLLLFLSLQSCISRKQTVYLQEEAAEEELLALTQNTPPYKVQINDILYINIKAENQELVSMFNVTEEQGGGGNAGAGLYFNGYGVDDHGNIRIPILGEMNVLGYTLEDIREQIENRLLSEYLTNQANLYVTVKLAGLNYTVLGEVGGPGTVTLFQNKVNILEALANAGDITLTGDRKDVILIRQYPTGKGIHHLDLTKVDLMNSPYFYILPNDMIYVKPLPQKALGTGTTGLQTFTTIFSVISVITSTVLLLRNIN